MISLLYYYWHIIAKIKTHSYSSFLEADFVSTARIDVFSQIFPVVFFWSADYGIYSLTATSIYG